MDCTAREIGLPKEVFFGVISQQKSVLVQNPEIRLVFIDKHLANGLFPHKKLLGAKSELAKFNRKVYSKMCLQCVFFLQRQIPFN